MDNPSIGNNPAADNHLCRVVVEDSPAAVDIPAVVDSPAGMGSLGRDLKGNFAGDVFDSFLFLLGDDQTHEFLMMCKGKWFAWVL